MKVLKFGAIWCSTCLVMKPRWEKIEKELEWLETEYYDVDEHENLVEQYKIKNFPCFIFLDKKGKELVRITGEVDKKKLLELINKYKQK